MAEDREKKREEGKKRPSRPVTAASRRERRASEPGADRPSSRAKADDKADGKASKDVSSKAERATKAEDGGAKGAASTKASKTSRTAKVSKTSESGKPKTKSGTSDSGGPGKGRPTPTRDRRDGQSLFGRIMRFLREVVAELRKVIWPTKKQMVTYTSVVLVFVVFMVSLIWGLDLALAKGVLWLFG